ncbi:hypothetical protein [Paracoccus sp. (in: a-proteobacteria)]|uniref:hypothetical protein n=1 Tax=Paracoccus sp. TaxID=267 RepID=UPI00272B2AF5|nr:hypothetical protein [Paracoccus sp. (in: a-proteobacteria)]
MSQPRTETAWLLVRKSSTLSDQDIIDATGVHPVTLTKMRQERSRMVAGGIESRESWALDNPGFVITHSEVIEEPAE